MEELLSLIPIAFALIGLGFAVASTYRGAKSERKFAKVIKDAYDLALLTASNLSQEQTIHSLEAEKTVLTQRIEELEHHRKELQLTREELSDRRENLEKLNAELEKIIREMVSEIETSEAEKVPISIKNNESEARFSIADTRPSETIIRRHFYRDLLESSNKEFDGLMDGILVSLSDEDRKYIKTTLINNSRSGRIGYLHKVFKRAMG